MPLKRAIIDQKIQIFDILCLNVPRFQKCKKIWNPAIITRVMGWNVSKTAQIWGFWPLLIIWQPLGAFQDT